MQTILIVDDNLDVCKPMAILVRHLGYDGQYATNGPAALNLVQTIAPDLVILDIMMPDMDGIEVLDRLKSDVRTQNIPVVMFSAVTDPEFRTNALNHGAIDYWIKSNVDYKELRGRIAKLLPQN